MYRAGFAGIILGLVVLTAGCRMCANPYDYCGPTFTGCGEGCPPDEPRAGSILAAGAVPVPSQEIDYTLQGSDKLSIVEPADGETADGETAGLHVVEKPVLQEAETTQESPGWTPSRRSTAAR